MKHLPSSQFKNIVAYEENGCVIKAFFDEGDTPREWIDRYSKHPRQLLEGKQIREFKQQLIDALQTFESQNGIYINKKNK